MSLGDSYNTDQNQNKIPMKFTTFTIETWNPHEEHDFVFELESQDILNQDNLAQLNGKLSAVIDNLKIDRVLTAISQYMIEADYIRDNWSRTQFKLYYKLEDEMFMQEEILTYQDVLKYGDKKNPLEKFVDSLSTNYNLHPWHQITFIEMQKHLIQEVLPKAIQDIKDAEAEGKTPFYSKYYFVPLFTAIAKASNDAFDNEGWNLDEVREFANALVAEYDETIENN